MLNTIYPLLVQLPTSSPKPGESTPIDLTKPFDVIVFIILPIIFIILYFVWRRNNKRDRDRDRDKNHPNWQNSSVIGKQIFSGIGLFSVGFIFMVNDLLITIRDFKK